MSENDLMNAMLRVAASPLLHGARRIEPQAPQVPDDHGFSATRVVVPQHVPGDFGGGQRGASVPVGPPDDMNARFREASRQAHERRSGYEGDYLSFTTTRRPR